MASKNVVDVEEFSEVSELMNTPPCTKSTTESCTIANCTWRCALRVIDELLSESGAVTGDEVDLLLDLRWHLSRRAEAEVALRLFCELRLRMEQRHYLPFFRIRRWMENHLVAEVRACPAAEPAMLPLKLDLYCVEAVRRVCLCAAARRGTALLVPRVQFAFRELPVPAARPLEVAAA